MAERGKIIPYVPPKCDCGNPATHIAVYGGGNQQDEERPCCEKEECQKAALARVTQSYYDPGGY